MRLRSSCILVVAVAGLGVFLAIPPAGCACRNPQMVQAKSDLRNLLGLEEAFLADSGRFTTDFPSKSFSPSAGLVVTFDTLTPSGFRARAEWADTLSGGVVAYCVAWIGDSTLAEPPGVQEGEPRCLVPRRPRWRFGAPRSAAWY